MRCPNCGSANVDTAVQCVQCGTALAGRASDDAQPRPVAADVQDAVNRLRRYVPAVVAEGILHDQDRLRGQRREITVLFADAVNFTHLSVSLDAELIFQLINDLLSRLVECSQYGQPFCFVYFLKQFLILL